MQLKTSPRQSHLGRVCRYPHVGECTLPLRVLAVVCTVRNEALRSVIVLSHWPHVATHVATQVAQLVAIVKGLGHKLPNLLLNVCPSAACAATSCVHRRPRLYLDVT